MLRSDQLLVRNTTEEVAQAWAVTTLECAARRLYVHWKYNARIAAGGRGVKVPVDSTQSPITKPHPLFIPPSP